MTKIIEIAQLILLPLTASSFVVLMVLIGSIKLSSYSEGFITELFKTKFGKPTFIITILGFISIFTLNSLKNKFIRDEIIDFVERPKNTEVKINGKIDNDFDAREFQKIKSESDRNIGNAQIQILLKNRDGIYPLTLIRSNHDENKYWIFSSKYSSTETNCIGEINTNSLNEY